MNLDILLTCNKYVSTKCNFSCFGIYNSINLFLHTFWFSDTPSRMYYLHTCCWVLNMFGIFFILAAHEHYSIDVVIAFYISSRLFLYYHTLANTRALKCIDSKRTRVWFPLFWFFEEKVSGKVPNEYEWPLKWPSFLCSKSKCQWQSWIDCKLFVLNYIAWFLKNIINIHVNNIIYLNVNLFHTII